MAGPWEQFQSPAAASNDGPWEKFAGASAPETEEKPRDANAIPYQVGRGAVAGTLGAPVDFANLLIHSAVAPFGGRAPEKPFLGSEMIGDTLDTIQNRWNRLIGHDEFAAPPEGSAERFANAAGSGVGGVLSPLAAIRGLSTAIPAVTNSKTVGALTNFFKNPTAKTLATETGMGAVSGLGAETGAEALPGNPVAPLVGGVLAPGALTAGSAATRAAGRAGASALRPFGVKYPFTDTKVGGGREEIAGNILRDSVQDPGRISTETSPPPIEGLQPTFAKDTGDLGLGALEQAAATRAPADYEARRSANNQVIRRAAEGASEGDPDAIRQAVTERAGNLTTAANRGQERAEAATRETQEAAAQRRAELAESAESEAQKAAGETGEAAGAAAPSGATREGSAENLHRDIMSQHAASEAAEREAWAPINAVKDLKFNAQPIKDDVDALTKDLTRSERSLLPSSEMGILKDWGGTEPFAELTTLKSAVGSAARTAARAGDANKARVIGKLEGILAKHLDDPHLVRDALEGEPGIREAYDNARAVTRAQKQQFNTDTETAGLFQRTGTGDVKVAPTETMARFVKPGPGGAEAFQSLVKALGGPEVLERAANGEQTALNHVRDWAVADLQAKPLTTKNVAAWRDRYAGMLREFPTLRTDVDKIGERAMAQETAEGKRDAVTRMVTDINGKELTPKSIAALKEKHADVLNANPAILDDLDAISQRLARQQQVTERRQALTKMLEKNSANTFTEGEPEWALGQLLKSTNLEANDKAVSQFTRFIKRSPEAAEGARRTMVDMLMRSGETGSVDQAGEKFLTSPNMVKFYEKNGRVFDALFPNAEQRDLVDRIVRAVKLNGRAGEGVQATGGPNTAQKLHGVEKFNKLAGEKYIDTLVGGGASKLMGLIGGAIGAVGGHGAVGAVVGMAEGPKIFKHLYERPRDKIMDLVNEALLDPEKARDLMRNVTPRNNKIVGPALIRYLGGTAVPARAAAAEDDEE